MATMLRLENMGELNFHQEDGLSGGKMHSNGWGHMPRVQEHSTESIFIHFSGCDSLFSECHIPIYSQSTPRGPKYLQEMLLRLALSLNNAIFYTATVYWETSLGQFLIATNDGHQMITRIVSQHVVTVQNITSFSDKASRRSIYCIYLGPLGVNWE